MANVDFGKTVEDYLRYRDGLPDALWTRMEHLGWLEGAAEVVDLGCGTGDLARHMARRGASVVGVDLSAEMMGGAARLAEAEGLAERLVWRQASAEATGLPSASCDLVTAGLCWHWFDPVAAVREVARLLRPGGRLIIAHLGWSRRPGSATVTTMETLEAHANVGAWSPLKDEGASNLYPAWLTQLMQGGLESIESFSLDLDVPYSHARWRGRMRASAAVGATLAPEQVEAFDAALAAALQARHPDPVAVPHRGFIVSAITPSRP